MATNPIYPKKKTLNSPSQEKTKTVFKTTDAKAPPNPKGYTPKIQSAEFSLFAIYSSVTQISEEIHEIHSKMKTIQAELYHQTAKIEYALSNINAIYDMLQSAKPTYKISPPPIMKPAPTTLDTDLNAYKHKAYDYVKPSHNYESHLTHPTFTGDFSFSPSNMKINLPYLGPIPGTKILPTLVIPYPADFNTTLLLSDKDLFALCFTHSDIINSLMASRRITDIRVTLHIEKIEAMDDLANGKLELPGTLHNKLALYARIVRNFTNDPSPYIHSSYDPQIGLIRIHLKNLTEKTKEDITGVILTLVPVIEAKEVHPAPTSQVIDSGPLP